MKTSDIVDPLRSNPLPTPPPTPPKNHPFAEVSQISAPFESFIKETWSSSSSRGGKWLSEQHPFPWCEINVHVSGTGNLGKYQIVMPFYPWHRVRLSTGASGLLSLLISSLSTQWPASCGQLSDYLQIYGLKLRLKPTSIKRPTPPDLIAVLTTFLPDHFLKACASHVGHKAITSPQPPKPNLKLINK